MADLKHVNPNSLTLSPINPRQITESEMEKLQKSIQEFPDMLTARPVVVNMEGVVLGGNMRVRAAQQLGMDSIPVREVDWSDDQQKEFMIKDNMNHGSWDWDILANEWEPANLNDWGLQVWDFDNYEPTLEPDTKYSGVTDEEVERRAKEMAERMIQEQKYRDLICPSCGHEYQIND